MPSRYRPFAEDPALFGARASTDGSAQSINIEAQVTASQLVIWTDGQAADDSLA
jgi:hypothetical protein